jgi:hypothetical protein
MARRADMPTMPPVSVLSRLLVASKACMQMAPHRELPFGYPRLRCKSSAKLASLLCTRFALKSHETENNTTYSAPIIAVTKNRFTRLYLLILAMQGVDYVISVKDLLLLHSTISAFCKTLITNIKIPNLLFLILKIIANFAM